ncbi:unnamed protein product, partial [marine sediment metagenome]
MLRNVASQKWRVYAFDATDGSAKTGDAANITAKLSKDGAALTATNDEFPTEEEAGWYYFDLTQAESHYASVEIVAVSSTADIEVVGSPSRQDPVPQYNSLLGIESDGDITKANLVANTTLVDTATLVTTTTTLTNKTGFSLAATGLDAIASTATGMVEIAKAIWDRVLTGAT